NGKPQTVNPDASPADQHTVALSGQFENLTGSNFGDLLFGSAGNNQLQGGSGSDILFGGDNRISFVGAVGNDTLPGALMALPIAIPPRPDGNDSLAGGTGNDTVMGGSGNDIIFGGDLRGSTNAVLGLDITTGDDTVPGSSDDLLIGGTGNDTVTGGSGN